MVKTLSAAYPDVRIAAIDYDPGSSAVNQELAVADHRKTTPFAFVQVIWLTVADNHLNPRLLNDGI